MKAQRSLQQAIRAGCMLIFLAGCAAYAPRLATQPAGLPLGSTQASLLADTGAPTRTARPPTPTVTPTIYNMTISARPNTRTPTQTASLTPTRTPTATRTAYTHIPPGLVKKTGTPARTHIIPPGLAKKTGTPTLHIPPGLAKKTGTPTPHIPPGQVKKTPTATATTTPTPVPPWTGSVLVEDGRYALGGCVGQTINIKVEFEASSPFGQVEEMKVLRSDDWEPFVPVKYYPHTFGPNWYYWRISVEYRDEHGNISPVYRDEILMEGWCYFTPTPTP